MCPVLLAITAKSISKSATVIHVNTVPAKRKLADIHASAKTVTMEPIARRKLTNARRSEFCIYRLRPFANVIHNVCIQFLGRVFSVLVSISSQITIASVIQNTVVRIARSN